MQTTPKNYFSDDELKCKHCGELKFEDTTRERLNILREKYGKPLSVTSGYRCSEYNDEKGYTQTHASGHAVDLRVSHKDALKVVELAIEVGFTGIGVNQKGSGRFIHLDDLLEAHNRPRPHIWSY